MKYKKLLLRQYTIQEYQPIIEHLYHDCLCHLDNSSIDKYYNGMVDEDIEEEKREMFFLKLINLLKDFPNETKNKIRKNISESLLLKIRDELFMDTEMIISIMCSNDIIDEDYDEENRELVQSEIKEEIEYLSSMGIVNSMVVEDDDEDEDEDDDDE